LNGHKANCVSVDFHPFGDFFASGSLDTDLKVWDARKKDCIQTYKGHAKGINAVHFSPDGRWVISGGDDGLVKVKRFLFVLIISQLWDLTAGKLIHDFDAHKGPISSVEFHPHEFLLATGSADRTVKFWDLETFSLVCSSDIESAPVRALSFYSEANCLFTAYTNTLRVR
jgi:katanin p80 WD40 repeat-containing subunit B1